MGDGFVIVVRLAVLLIASSVVSRGFAPQPAGRLLERLGTADDPSQTFTAYLPPGYDRSRRWPLLFVFDPRGRGTLAAKIFQPAAERYGWIIISSDNTRSDGPWEPNARALAALWPDALARYAVDPRRIYAAGFSGGATVAWVAGASTGELAGMIAAGQPAQAAILKTTPAPAWFGAAGRHDFNYRDTLAIRDHLAEKADVRTEFFEGPHQWLGTDAAIRAVGWLEMLAIRDGRRAGDAALVRETLRGEMQRAAVLEAASRQIEAVDTYRALVRTYDGIAPLDDLRARLAEVTSGKAYKAALDEDRKAARYERSHTTDAMRALERLFGGGDLPPSMGAVNELRVDALRRDAARGGAVGDAAARTLEQIFVQTAFYLPDKLQAKQRYRESAVALEIATAIHPSRPAPWYSLAQARARAGSVDAAFAALGRAIEAGFGDAARMDADTAFDRLRSDKRWRPLLQRIPRGP
jgi:dienelactone hydrolase